MLLQSPARETQKFTDELKNFRMVSIEFFLKNQTEYSTNLQQFVGEILLLITETISCLTY